MIRVHFKTLERAEARLKAEHWIWRHTDGHRSCWTKNGREAWLDEHTFLLELRGRVILPLEDLLEPPHPHALCTAEAVKLAKLAQCTVLLQDSAGFDRFRACADGTWGWV